MTIFEQLAKQEESKSKAGLGLGRGPRATATATGQAGRWLAGWLLGWDAIDVEMIEL